MTLVMFFGGAWGYLQLLKLPVPPGQTSALPAGGGSLLADSTALTALAVLVGTAALAGVLAAVPRLSPLASGLPGLLLLAWTGLYLASVRQAVALIPLRSHAFGAGWEALLFNGILGVAGVVMVFPLFIPSRWRLARRAETESIARDVDDFLTAVTAESDGPQERDDRPRERDSRPRERDSRPRGDDDWQRGDEELVGTVLPRRAATRPVDTSRITGASRALRNTGSFSMAAGAHPRATGSMPRSTGSMPRAHGSPRRPANGLFERPQDE